MYITFLSGQLLHAIPVCCGFLTCRVGAILVRYSCHLWCHIQGDSYGTPGTLRPIIS
jgi:hypothetical protein